MTFRPRQLCTMVPRHECPGGGGQFFHGDNISRSDTGISNDSRFESVRCSVRTFLPPIKYSLRIKTITNNCMIRCKIYMCLCVRVYSAKVEPKKISQIHTEVHIREKLALFAIYEIVKATFVHLLNRDNRGAYRIFQKGRLRPAIRNAGGGGGGGGVSA